MKYWELGNEETYPGFEDYAQRVNAYSAAMRAIDPTIELGVISSGTGLDAVYGQQAWLDYRTLMLERAGDSFDFWIQHLHTPGTNGIANGFSMVQEGASVEVSFSVDQAGDYWFDVPAEGSCKSLQCPGLSLQVDGETVGAWTVSLYSVLRSGSFNLERGEHRLRLEADSVVNGARVTVRQQLNLYRAGAPDPLWVDLKKSRAWYDALLGGWPVSEKVYRIGEAFAGGKPVFFTEANTAYEEVTSPPYYSKSCYLREMLSTGCIYHFLLRNGVPLANYWLLFHDRAGIGVLEGVAHDDEAGEVGRLDPHRRPVFHLLKAYRWNVFDWMISTEVLDSESFQVGPQTGITLGYAHQDFEISYLQALATITEAEDKLSLFVINLHPDEDIQAPVALEGFSRKATVEVLTITGPSPDASNEPEDCPAGDCVTTESGASTRWQPVYVSVPETLRDGLRLFRDRRGRTASSRAHRPRRECRGRTGLSLLGGEPGGRPPGVQRVSVAPSRGPVSKQGQHDTARDPGIPGHRGRQQRDLHVRNHVRGPVGQRKQPLGQSFGHDGGR